MEIKMRKLMNKLSIILAFFALTACGKSGSSELYWFEEALQDDGSIVLVKKYEASFSVTRKEPGANTYGYRLPKVEVTDPKTGKPVVWYPRGLPPLLPYALHVHQQVLYMFATPYLPGEYSELGCPRPPYIVFRWEGDRWKRITLSDLPIQFKRHNLLDVAGDYQYEDGVEFRITPGRLVKASTIEMAVRRMSGNPREFKPVPAHLYEREIQYTDLGAYFECSKYNQATKYDGMEIK
jgi:hypothetical protein